MSAADSSGEGPPPGNRPPAGSPIPDRVPESAVSDPGLERARELPLPVRLFLIPALIVVAVGVVLLLYRLLGGAESTPRQMLDEIRSGSGHRRWQAAYELAHVLTRDEEVARDPALGREMARLFEESAGRDPRVRRYLALGLGRAQVAESVPSLTAALADPDAETRVYSAWALGAIGDSSAAPALEAQAADPDPGMRKIVAYALGALGARSSGPVLQGLLADSTPDVRWNAALALARLGDDSGREILGQMIDREYLAGISGMTPEQREAVVVNGVEGLALIGGGAFRAELDALAERDPSPTVRAAADRARR